jgi:hypothetical protein
LKFSKFDFDALLDELLSDVLVLLDPLSVGGCTLKIRYCAPVFESRTSTSSSSGSLCLELRRLIGGRHLWLALLSVIVGGSRGSLVGLRGLLLSLFVGTLSRGGDGDSTLREVIFFDGLPRLDPLLFIAALTLVVVFPGFLTATCLLAGFFIVFAGAFGVLGLGVKVAAGKFFTPERLLLR